MNDNYRETAARNRIDAEAYDYARINQGYTGTWEEWQAMDADTRQQYELGAAGIPTD